MLRPEMLETYLDDLGELLARRGLSYEIVIVGGASLALRRFIVRPTIDIDVVALVRHGKWEKAKPLPEPLLQAARDIATEHRLGDRWFNSGPADLMDFGLPDGFEDRTESRRYGNLTVRIAGRFDQVCLKVYAAVDQAPQSRHLDDLRDLHPTTEELLSAGRWARTHDPSEGFRSQLLALLRLFAVEDAGDKV